MTSEIWKPVVGYESLYEVSSLGRVRSIPRPRAKGGIRKLSVRSNGYLYLPLQKNQRKKQALVHRLVAEAFLGPQPSDRHRVTHINGQRQDNRLENLAWRVRLVSREDVDRAAELQRAGMSIRKIADKIGIRYGTIAKHLAARA